MASHNPMDVDRSGIFDRRRYLALRGVEEAYSHVDGQQAMTDLLSGFANHLVSYGQGDTFGVFLLHRHFAPGPGSIPLERATKWGTSSGLALVTQMMEPGLETKCAPSRWLYNNDLEIFEAIEYSTDPLVLKEWAKLQMEPELMRGVAKILEESGLSDFLGFTIADRSALTKTVDEVYSETSESFEAASVIRVEPRSYSPPSNQIPTCWVPSVACWCEADTLCAWVCIGYGSDDNHMISDHNPVEIGHRLVPCV